MRLLVVVVFVIIGLLQICHASPCSELIKSNNSIGFCVATTDLGTKWYKTYHVFSVWPEDMEVFQSGTIFPYNGEFNLWMCLCWEPETGGDKSCEMFAERNPDLIPGMAAVWMDGLCIIPYINQLVTEPDPDPLHWDCNDGLTPDCEGTP